MKKFLTILLVFVLVLTLVPFAAFAAGSRIPGDVNDDGSVNAKDVTTLRRFLAGGYGSAIQEIVSDMTGEGAINAKDVTTLRRFLAGGYGIVLPEPPAEKPELKPDETPRIPLP